MSRNPGLIHFYSQCLKLKSGSITMKGSTNLVYFCFLCKRVSRFLDCLVINFFFLANFKIFLQISKQRKTFLTSGNTVVLKIKSFVKIYVAPNLLKDPLFCSLQNLTLLKRSFGALKSFLMTYINLDGTSQYNLSIIQILDLVVDSCP